jgi:hypothetical protein
MTFVARQRRALSEIECMLRRTDPYLTSKFGMFSRLADDEEMPSAERVISGSARQRNGMPRIGQLPCRPRGLLCIAAAAAAIMAALLLAGAGGHVRCVPVHAAQIYYMQSGGAATCAANLARPTVGGLRAWPR